MISLILRKLKGVRLFGTILVVVILASSFQALGLPTSITATSPPTQGTPLLVSSGGTNSIHESLIASNRSTAGVGRVTNVYNWYKNGVSYTNLLMPFESNSPTMAEDYSGYANNGNVTRATWTSRGVVGGAYNFNGVNSSITVQDSLSLGGDGNWAEISIEFWVKAAAPQHGSRIIARKTASNSTGSYMVGFQTSSSEPANTLFWGITTNDGDYYDLYNDTTTVIPTGVWTHVVCTFRSDTGLTIYINGVQKANRSLQATIEGPSNPINYEKNEKLFIGCSGENSPNRWLNGTLDEVRIYPKKLTPDQIMQRYSETKSGSSNSSTMVPQEINDIYQNVWTCKVTPNDGTQDGTGRFSNPLTVLIFEPVIQNQNPTDRAFQVSASLTRLSFRLVDYQGKRMNYSVATSPSIGSGVGGNVANGTLVNVPVNGPLKVGTTYTWQVRVTDGSYWTNKTYTFNTALITLKWVTTGLPHGFSGVIIGPLFKGAKEEEVIQAGTGSVTCLNGTNGKVIWTYSDTSIGFYCQPQMADLNKDGNLEIVVPLEFPAGCLALFGNGSRYWRTGRLGAGSITSSPVVADVDGNGYPTIFIGAEDIITYQGSVTALRGYNGQVLRQTWAYRPCSGGFSLADCRNDGQFKLFMGDRAAGDAINATTGQSIGGQGVRCWDARTFKSLWNRTDILCSSQSLILADVNGDGVLEAIVENQRDRVYVLNTKDGSTIRASVPTNPSSIPGHYKPVVYDIDHDGHLEILLADGEHGNTPNYILVLDLVTLKEKARIEVGLCTYPPNVAEVTGDGIMDIIACNYTAVFILDGKNYSMRDAVGNLVGRLNYATVQDIDSDGLNEIVVQSSWDRVYAFDTPAKRPAQRARSEVQYYSERRLGAAEYVPLP